MLSKGTLLSGKQRDPDVANRPHVDAPALANSMMSKALSYGVWATMAVVAAVVALDSSSVLSGRAGFLFGVLLAAVALLQLVHNFSSLPRRELVLAAVALSLFCVGQIEQRVYTVHSRIDFSAYYVAGGLASGGPSQKLYFLTHFSDGRLQVLPPDNAKEHAEFQGVSASTPFIYPPFFAVVMKPFAHFSYDVSYTLWTTVAALLVLATVLICFGLGGGQGGLKLLLILGVGVFSYYPLFQELRLGQVSAITLYLWASGIWLFSRNQVWSSALFFALATMIKLTPVIAIPLMVFCRKWKWLTGYACWIFCLLAFSIWQAGWSAHVQFLRSVLPSITCGVPVAGNTSLVAYVQELFLGYVPLIASAPSTLPRFACGVSKLIAFAVFGALMLRFYLHRSESNLVRHLVLSILLSLVISPISWWHHYTLALLPFIYLWSVMRQPGRDLLLLVTVLVVGTNIVGFALELTNNRIAQLILAAVVPCLTIALVYFRIPRTPLAIGHAEST